MHSEVCGTVVARWTADHQVKQSILHQGMIHNKIHLISPGCSRPSIALQVQNGGLKHHSFIVFLCISFLFLFFSFQLPGSILQK